MYQPLERIMNKFYRIILTLLLTHLSNSVFCQLIDKNLTLTKISSTEYGVSNLVTLDYSKKYPCLFIDTLSYWDSKYNGYSEGKVLFSFLLNKEDCKLNPNKINQLTERRNAKEYLNKKYIPIETYLIQDRLNPNLFYDPHAMFKVKIKNTYYFSLIAPEYEIPNKELLHGLSIFETVPNAFKSFYGFYYKMNIYSGNQLLYSKEYKENDSISRKVFEKYTEQEFDIITIEINNSFSDKLEMKFNIIRN